MAGTRGRLVAADPSDYDTGGQRALLPDTNLVRYSSFIVWSTIKQNPQPLITLTESSIWDALV